METFVVRALWSEVDRDVHGLVTRVADGIEQPFAGGAELLQLLHRPDESDPPNTDGAPG